MEQTNEDPEAKIMKNGPVGIEVINDEHIGKKLSREDFDGGPVSIDEIEPGIFLGNLTAATHMETLKSLNITHILTLDCVPLPQHITEASFLTTKHIKVFDMPHEDLLQYIEQCIEFIDEALFAQKRILVHCYYGMSRSSAIVIAYVMKTRNQDYEHAFDYVKSKRRFVQPNVGFVAQLKLFRRMGCKIDPSYQKFKTYRLRMAGEQVRMAKILPHNFHCLIKADPSITQEKPEPIVYRCRKCRRILATKSHVLEHASKHVQVQQQQQQHEALDMKLEEQILRKASLANTHTNGILEQNTYSYTNACTKLLFIEPIAWMHQITNSTQGRLTCPKCAQKLGNFSWINACKCPCGETLTPAFYLIPSKIELSKAVQNVQTTI